MTQPDEDVPDLSPVFLIDEWGDPLLLAAPVGGPRADKTGSSVQVQVRSGNPFRDPGSGTFGAGPGGAKVGGPGKDALKRLSQPAALYLTQMRNKFQADSLSVVEKDGRVEIVLLKNGKQVGTLNLPVQGAAGEPDKTQAVQPKEQVQDTRDSIVDRARSATSIDKLDDSARQQRVSDLVDYLFARYNVSGAIFSKPGTVRIEAPAGWDRKTIGGLSDQELQDVSRRLGARGWSPDALKKVLLPNIKAVRRNAVLQTPAKTKEK